MHSNDFSLEGLRNIPIEVPVLSLEMTRHVESNLTSFTFKLGDGSHPWTMEFSTGMNAAQDGAVELRKYIERTIQANVARDLLSPPAPVLKVQLAKLLHSIDPTNDPRAELTRVQAELVGILRPNQGSGVGIVPKTPKAPPQDPEAVEELKRNGR